MLEYAGRFSKPELMIKQGKFWSIVFRESTTTLGNCVFICNRQCSTFGDLTAEEMSEFPEMCKWYEPKIKKLYGAVKFNYIANMMREDFVHFHVLPRYEKDIERYGLIWKDEDFPNRSKMGKIEISEDVKAQIIADLKA